MTVNQKPPVSNNLIKKRITSLIKQNGYSDELSIIVVNLYDYMCKKQMYGCCHAFSSVLYVALKELGLSPELHIGICAAPNTKPFDHSWIEVDGRILDLAIYMPMTQKINDVSGPIICGVDVVTMRPCLVEYGIVTSLPFDDATEIVLNTPFGEYMNHYPFERGGLWTTLQFIFIGVKELDIPHLRTVYSNVERIRETHNNEQT